MSMSTMSYNTDSFSYNPAEYVDAGATILPLPGTYRFRVTSLGRRKDRNTGAEVTRDGWPILMLNRVEILEPQDEGGTFSLFEEINTKPYMRKSQMGEKPAARHMDLLRAIDQGSEVRSFEEGVTEVESLLSGGQTFVAQLGYKGIDTTWAKAQIAENGGEACEKATKNRIWNEAKLMTKDFKNPDGTYRTQTTGRSGSLIEAKLTLTKFSPSDQETALGPYTR